MNLKTARTIGIRLDDEQNRRLKALEDKTKVGAVDLFRCAGLAAIEWFETHGSITFPLVVVPEAKASTAAPIESPAATAKATSKPAAKRTA